MKEIEYIHRLLEDAKQEIEKMLDEEERLAAMKDQDSYKGGRGYGRCPLQG